MCTSFKTLLTFGAIYNWEVHQMDVKGVFLNGKLIKDVYMEQLDECKVLNK
jgi:hypothetical protein